MSTPEQKVIATAEKVSADLTTVKGWYEDHRFYAGIALGIVAGALVFHYLAKL